MTTTSNQQVAQTILSQLGGKRFIAMTGCSNFLSDTHSLRRSNPWNLPIAIALSFVEPSPSARERCTTKLPSPATRRRQTV